MFTWKITQFLKLRSTKCAFCHKNEGFHLLRDGFYKICHECHVKLNKRKSGYQGKSIIHS